MDTDTLSIWSNDEGPPDTFNITRLRTVVDAHFGRKCTLVKLAQGGYHKVPQLSPLHLAMSDIPSQVYEVFITSDDGQPGVSLDAVVRVASSAFPGDKMRSEVRYTPNLRSPLANKVHFRADALCTR